MHVRTMPTVNFKKTKKLLAKKNDRDYDSLIGSKTHAAPLLNNQQIQRMAPGVRLAGSLRVETIETNPVNRSPDAQHEA